MGTAGTQAQRVDVIRSTDPRSTGYAAKKGTLYRYIPASGSPELLIKTDDGFSVNWTPLGAEASVPFYVEVASVADVDTDVAPATIDGIAYTTVLLKDQAAPAENGVYDFVATGEPLVRNASWNTAGEFTPGRQVYVDGGNTQADTLWENLNAVVTLGTTAIAFRELGSGVAQPDFEYQVGPGQTYTTIQSAIAQAATDGCGVGTVKGIIKIAPGVYTEDLVFVKGITMQSDSQGLSYNVVQIVGQHTITPGALNPDENTYNFCGISFRDADATGYQFTVGGSNAARVQFFTCFLQKAGAAGGIITNANITCEINLENSNCQTTTLSSDPAIVSASNVLGIRFCTFNMASPVLRYTGTGVASIVENIFNTDAIYVLSIEGGTGLMTGGACTNSQANSDGARVSTGAVLFCANVAFQIPVGTGFAIEGAGILAAGIVAFSQNNGIEGTITQAGIGAKLSAGNFEVESTGNIKTLRTITPGATVGDQVINKPQGSVNFAAAAGSLTVTNSLVTADSVVLVTMMTNDATAVLKCAVPGAGSFTIQMSTVPTAETRVGFLVLN